MSKHYKVRIFKDSCSWHISKHENFVPWSESAAINSSHDALFTWNNLLWCSNLLMFLLVCETATINSEVTAFFLIKLLHFKRILIYWDNVQIFDRSAWSFVSFSYLITYWQLLKQLYSVLKRQSLPSTFTLLNSVCTISSKVSPFCITPKHHTLVCEQYWSVHLWNIIDVLHTNHTHHGIGEELLKISRNDESSKFFGTTEVSLVFITCKLI